MRKILIICCLFSTVSCATKSPVISSQERFYFNTTEVKPQWEKSKGAKGATTLFFSILGAAAGGGTAYLITGSPETNEEKEKLVGLATFGVLIGSGLGGGLAGKMNRKRRDVTRSEFNEWVKAFNEKNNKNYSGIVIGYSQRKYIIGDRKTIQGINNYRSRMNLYSNDIRSEKASLSDIKRYREDIVGSRYKVLFDTKYLLSSMDEYEKKLGDESIVYKAEEAISKVNEFSDVDILINFKSENRDLYNVASLESKQEVERMIHEKGNTLLSGYIRNEKPKLDKIQIDPISFKNISKVKDINDLTVYFEKYYSDYLMFSSVQNLENLIKEKKTELVLSFKSSIENLMNASTSVQKLDSYFKIYLTYTDINNSDIRKLINIYRSKRSELISEEEKRRERQRELDRLNEIRKIMSATTSTGEPTEEQMEFASDFRMQQRVRKITGLENLEGQNPVTAVLKLYGMSVSGVRASISEFQKYGCTKSDSKPGFYCNYYIKERIRGGLPGAMFGELLDALGGTVKTSYFQKINGFWFLIE